MRRKILIGLIIVAVLGIATGDYLFNRSSGAQDAPKKLEPYPKKPGNLFDILQKDIETVLPPLPPKSSTPEIPPPAAVVDDPNLKPRLPVPNAGAPDAVAQPAPMPNVGGGSAVPSPVPAPPPALEKPAPLSVKVGEPLPAPVAGNPGPPAQPTVPPPPSSLVPQPGPGAIPSPLDPVKPAASINPPPAPSPSGPIPAPAAQVAPPASALVVQTRKTCPWSLHIEIVNDQTIVTATVNKKHEFKVICQHVDLQTSMNMLKATGKVQINGDALQGNCDRLMISLTEDRLILEGGAEVRIQKTAARATDVSDTKPAAFELKGEILNLRISELQSANLAEPSTSWRKVADDSTPEAGKTVLASATREGKQTWSPIGTLSRTTLTHDGRPVWRLDNKAGQPVLHFVTREGGNLTQYEGRSISVLGNALEPSHSSMRTLLHVTHIALP